MPAPEVSTEEIAQALAALHADYYGRGPSSASAHYAGDTLVVLFEESFTRAELALIERGEAEEVQTIRRRFQQAMADAFITIVEQATGRAVRSFVSDTDLEQHLSIETFVLAGERQDMAGFEGSDTFEESDADRDEREAPG